ncbi:MAG: hypothetical protein V4621_04435 [Pseudomonadota bacterium]
MNNQNTQSKAQLVEAKRQKIRDLKDQPPSDEQVATQYHQVEALKKEIESLEQRILEEDRNLQMLMRQ